MNFHLNLYKASVLVNGPLIIKGCVKTYQQDYEFIIIVNIFQYAKTEITNIRIVLVSFKINFVQKYKIVTLSEYEGTYITSTIIFQCLSMVLNAYQTREKLSMVQQARFFF